MTRKKMYLLTESLLCALIAGLLAGAAVRMYVHGAAVQASGDLFYHIFTRETVGAALLQFLPLLSAFTAFTVSGLLLEIRDESADKPVFLKGADLKKLTAKAVPQKTGRRARILRIVILLLAVVLIILGIRNGGMENMFAKGAAICTECVGLG